MVTLMTPIQFNRAMFAIPALFLSAQVFSADTDTNTKDAEPQKEAVVYDSNTDFTAYRAANTPVNYSYVALNVGKTDYETFNDAATTAGARGQVLLNERFIFKMGYEAAWLDEDNAGNDLSYQSNKFNIGLGLRHPIFESTDIELDTHLLYNWSSNELTDDEDKTLGFKVGAYINQGIGDSFEGTLGVDYTSQYSEESVNVVLSITQYVTEYVGVGIDGRFGASDDKFSGDTGYLGAHLHLAFY